jgi:hypothetical protein
VVDLHVGRPWIQFTPLGFPPRIVSDPSSEARSGWFEPRPAGVQGLLTAAHRYRHHGTRRRGIDGGLSGRGREGRADMLGRPRSNLPRLGLLHGSYLIRGCSPVGLCWAQAGRRARAPHGHAPLQACRHHKRGE